jgi:hypothetical protein
MLHSSYFLFNQLTSHAGVFVAVHVYASSGLTQLPARMLWTSSCAIFAAWALSYVLRACERSSVIRV